MRHLLDPFGAADEKEVSAPESRSVMICESIGQGIFLGRAPSCVPVPVETKGRFSWRPSNGRHVGLPAHRAQNANNGRSPDRIACLMPGGLKNEPPIPGSNQAVSACRNSPSDKTR